MSEENNTGEGGDERNWLLVAAVLVAVPLVLVILIGIVVVLAAILGTFVLGIGSDVPDTPQASFDFEYQESGEVTVRHAGGESIDASDVQMTVDGDPVGTWESFTDEETIRAGSELRLVEVRSGTVVRLVWQGPESTAVLAAFEAP